MAAGTEIKLGTRVFPSKRAATDFFKAMLRSYKNYDEIDAEDSLLLSELLKRHPDYPDKRGPGIVSFWKRPSMAGAACFWVYRVDGTATDFSFHSCISASRPNLRTRFAIAARESVWSEIARYKRAYFDAHANSEGLIVCPLSGCSLSFSEAHVDHEPPHTFSQLVADFLEFHGEPEESWFTPRGDAQFMYSFANSEVESRFIEHHWARACLRVISAQENMRLGASHVLVSEPGHGVGVQPLLIPE